METSLSEGLLLEDRNIRLEWGLSHDELIRRTSPNFCTPFDRAGVQTLVWNTQVLGGMACQITTQFGGGVPPQTSLSRIRLVVWYPESVRTCPQGFIWLQEELANRFGLPVAIKDDGEQGEAIWGVNNVTIRHSYFNGMGGHHCIFVFLSTNKPPSLTDSP